MISISSPSRPLALCLTLALAPCATANDQAPSDPAQARELSDFFRQVADQAAPAVVQIYGYGMPNQPADRPLTASGFLISAAGDIVTNNHVVESTSTLIVEFTDGRRSAARLIGADPLTDLAVIRMTPASPSAALPPAFLSFVPDDQAPLRVGDWVIAVGYPLGLEQTVTAGIVSAVNRHLDILSDSQRKGYEDYIQTDAAINRGNSGGPLLDLDGRVVGVNAAIKSSTGGSDGLGFAIPARIARHVTEQLIAHGRVQRGFLGIDLQSLDPLLARSYGLPETHDPAAQRDPAAHRGILVTGLVANLPAAIAGVQVEDIITAVDGRPIRDSDDFRTYLAMRGPGAVTNLRIFRAGAFLDLSVTLAEIPGFSSSPAPDAPSPDQPIDSSLPAGLRISDARLRDQSTLQIQEVIPGSPAHLADLRGGDLIIAVNSLPIADFRTRNDQPPITPAAAPAIAQSDAQWLTAYLSVQPSGTIVRFTIRHSRGTGRQGSSFADPTFIALQLP